MKSLFRLPPTGSERHDARHKWFIGPLQPWGKGDEMDKRDAERFMFSHLEVLPTFWNDVVQIRAPTMGLRHRLGNSSS